MHEVLSYLFFLFQENKLLGLTRVNHDISDLNPDSRKKKDSQPTVSRNEHKNSPLQRIVDHSKNDAFMHKPRQDFWCAVAARCVRARACERVSSDAAEASDALLAGRFQLFLSTAVWITQQSQNLICTRTPQTKDEVCHSSFWSLKLLVYETLRVLKLLVTGFGGSLYFRSCIYGSKPLRTRSCLFPR